jgi:hypothetical protein
MAKLMFRASRSAAASGGSELARVSLKLLSKKLLLRRP